MFDFVGKKRYFFVLSAAIILIGIIFLSDVAPVVGHLILVDLLHFLEIVDLQAEEMDGSGTEQQQDETHGGQKTVSPLSQIIADIEQGDSQGHPEQGVEEGFLILEDVPDEIHGQHGQQHGTQIDAQHQEAALLDEADDGA